MNTVYDVDPSTVFKYCSLCNLKKPLDAFGKNGKTTIRSECKECRNQRDRDKRKGKVTQRPLIVISKICRGCRAEKSLEDFYPAEQGKYKRSSHCKDCKNNVSKEWHRKTYPEKADGQRAYAREYRRTHPDRPKHKHVLTERDYAHMQEYYAANREERIAKTREWAKANPFKVAEMRDRRRARLKNATIGKVSYASILERDGMWCYICEKAIEPHCKIHFDHVIPLDRGGSHSEENIKVTHSTCNLRKNRRLLEEMTHYMRRGIA